MKILFVTESLGSGGAERQLVGLAIMLKNSGYEVAVLTYFDKSFYKYLLDDNGIYNEVCLNALNKYTRFFVLNKRVKQFNADVVISFLPGSNPILGLGKCLGYLRTKLILSERNYTWNWSMKKKLYFLPFIGADAVIANSKAESDNIKTHCPYLASKTNYIQNFVDNEKFLPKEHEKHDIFRVLSIARLRSYKNVHSLIKVASILKKERASIRFDWYGNDYEDECSKTIKDMIKENHLEDTFILHKPTINVVDIYPTADVFCLPSFKEGYPNVIIEAMCCQLPVICSNLCENPVIVEDGINGYLFNPDNVDEIVCAIKKVIMMSPQERTKMGVRNREKMIANNSKEFFLKKYVELIKSVTA